jgi:DNA mismatch repair ATPase MutS
MTTFDSLAEGLSTFTMEMKELQISLKYKKKKTLFLFDEIGRGTSADDGEAIAYATLDFLTSQENNSVTFFATHYHNLVPAISKFDNIQIKHMDCIPLPNNKIKFSRKLIDGPGDGSYGIIVAASCGVPDVLIRSAQNYNKIYAPLKRSRYNKKVEGIICPFCENNPVQETHHIVDQLQGKVESILINGVKKSINHPSNIIMICGSCHNKITRKELIVNTKRDIE